MYLILLIVISFLIFGFKINSFPLRNWDEAWYAEIIRNMISGLHGFLVPFWNGQYYFDKPPLYFWLSLPIVKIFGIGEWQVRIISVVAAIFSVILIYKIGKKLFSERTGFFASLIFLTLGQVIARFSGGNLDALAICLFLATFYFYLKSLENKYFLLLSGILFGFGFLVKGWLLGLFPLMLITVFQLFDRKIQVRKLSVVIFVSLIPSFLWFVLGYREFGRKFIDWYFFNPSAGGLNGNVYFSWDLIKYLVRDLGLWPITVFPLFFLIKKIKIDKRKTIFSFLVSALFFVFSLYLLKERMNWYLLPAYPLIALVLGYLMDKILILSRKTAIVIVTVIIVLGTIIPSFYSLIIKKTDYDYLSANLGLVTKKIIPNGGSIILDNSDFTSFLYYSEYKEIFVASEYGGKPDEWWIIKYSTTPEFIKTHPNTWIVTSVPERFGLNKDDSFSFEYLHYFFRVSSRDNFAKL